MDEKRTDFRAAFRELAAEEAGDVGLHVGWKRLIAYREGALPAEESEAVQEHLFLCPRCARLLLELRDFEAATAGGEAGPESQKREAWNALVRRLPPQDPAVRPMRPRRLAPALASVAAALLLALIGVSLWMAAEARQDRQRLARLERSLAERETAIEALRRSLAETERQLAAALQRGQPSSREGELAAKVEELTAALEDLRRAAPEQIAAASPVDVHISPRFVLRGQEAPGGAFLRPGGVVNRVRASSQKKFTVTLSLADQAARDEYQLELVDREDKVLWEGRRPARSFVGDAGTSVSITGLRPGLYRLRIKGLGTEDGELLTEYLLKTEP